jgi:nitrous oxidase accessory protein NosD
MLTEIGRIARCRWAAAAVMGVMAGGIGLAGVAPAAASPRNLVDCNTNHHALQPAIDGAAQDMTLLVTGTCTGPFTISKNLVLNGIGRAVLDGNQAGRTVTVGSGARVRLDSLIITNGTGGINNQGTLTVCGSDVSGNTASNGPGGGIHNAGTLVVCLSTVRDNYSAGAGGAINNNGSLTVSGSRLSGNSADNCGGIDSSVGTGITATVIRSSIHGNIARLADGGGVCNTVTLSDSVVYGNTARFGGGIYENGSTATVIRSAVVHNTASDQGGGIYKASGTVTLNQSLVRDNKPDNCDPSGSVPGCAG